MQRKQTVHVADFEDEVVTEELIIGVVSVEVIEIKEVNAEVIKIIPDKKIRAKIPKLHKKMVKLRVLLILKRTHLLPFQKHQVGLLNIIDIFMIEYSLNFIYILFYTNINEFFF